MKHLATLQKTRAASSSKQAQQQSQQLQQYYERGFDDCLLETKRLISQLPQLSPFSREAIVKRLNEKMHRLGAKEAPFLELPSKKELVTKNNNSAGIGDKQVYCNEGANVHPVLKPHHAVLRDVSNVADQKIKTSTRTPIALSDSSKRKNDYQQSSEKNNFAYFYTINRQSLSTAKADRCSSGNPMKRLKLDTQQQKSIDKSSRALKENTLTHVKNDKKLMRRVFFDATSEKHLPQNPATSLPDKNQFEPGDEGMHERRKYLEATSSSGANVDDPEDVWRPW